MHLFPSPADFHVHSVKPASCTRSTNAPHAKVPSTVAEHAKDSLGVCIARSASNGDTMVVRQ